jgi:hypothetical protein
MTYLQLQEDLDASVGGAQTLTREIMGSSIRFLIQCHRFTPADIHDTVQQLLEELAGDIPNTQRPRLQVVAGTQHHIATRKYAVKGRI